MKNMIRTQRLGQRGHHARHDADRSEPGPPANSHTLKARALPQPRAHRAPHGAAVHALRRNAAREVPARARADRVRAEARVERGADTRARERGGEEAGERLARGEREPEDARGERGRVAPPEPAERRCGCVGPR